MLTLGLLATLVSNTALAGGDGDRQVQVKRRGDGKLVYVAPPLVVQGQVQRPQALFVLPRPRVSYQWPELQRPPQPPIARDVDR